MKWDYRVEGDLGQHDLARLGGEGWELVAVVVAPNGWDAELVFYFKRKVR